MGLLSWLTRPQAASQPIDGGKRITSPEDLEAAIRLAGMGSASGIAVTPDSAMRVAAVFACIRLRSGAVANMPVHVKRRVDDRTREDVTDHPVWRLFHRRPNRWQKPGQFKRMMEAHLLLRGNAYAMKVRSGRRIIALIPLNPDRVEVKQQADMSLVYRYKRPDGGTTDFRQDEILHLAGLTLDGVTGVSAITYAREAIGLSMAQDRHGATTFRNAARPSIVLKHPGRVGKEGLEFLKASVDQYRSGGDSEGSALILEEGMDATALSMTAEDAQWIEARKFSRTDIAMFFGVPPHMIGDTDKSTSWGTGLEQQSLGFVAYTLEDSLTTWEEAINCDLIADDETNIYARFNRASLIRGDIKTRTAAMVQRLQWGMTSPNEERALEDRNPREGGDVYYDPPNTAGSSGAENGDGDEPPQPS